MPHSAGSLPPSKRHSRLTIVRRGCKWYRNAGVHGKAMYTAPDCAARAVIRATNWQCRGSRGPPLVLSLGGVRGIFSFREREYPPLPRPHTVWGQKQRCRAAPPCALRAQKETALAGCFPPAPGARKLSKLSIWDTYPHFPPFSLDNMRY